MRRTIRHPLTEYACELIIQDLAKFKEQGYEPGPVLRESIKNSWRGVFLPNENGQRQVAKAISIGKGPAIGFGCRDCKRRFDTPGQRDGHDCQALKQRLAK